MSITTLTNREFSGDVSRAIKAAALGPVFITSRNKPMHVLLSMDEYKKLKSGQSNHLDDLSMPGLSDIEFEPPRLHIGLKVPDLD